MAGSSGWPGAFEASPTETGHAEAWGAGTGAAAAACPWKVEFTVHVPASVLQAEMTKQKYLYIGTNNHASAYPQWKLATGTASQPQRVADDEYQVTLSCTPSNGAYATHGFCTMPTEAQDGFGLPGPSACGAAVLPNSDLFVFGSAEAPAFNAGG